MITGTGWQPAEVVSLLLHEEPPIEPDPRFYAGADAAGNIINDEFKTDSTTSA